MPTHKPKAIDKKPINITGDNLSVAGFAVAIASIFINFFTFGLTALVGLGLSIMGRVQTSKAGRPSGLALAGIIISGIVIFLTFIAFSLLVLLLVLASVGTTDADVKSNIECQGRAFSVECREKNNTSSPTHEFRHDRS
jgi:hypothetical protein